MRCTVATTRLTAQHKDNVRGLPANKTEPQAQQQLSFKIIPTKRKATPGLVAKLEFAKLCYTEIEAGKSPTLNYKNGMPGPSLLQALVRCI